MRRGLAGFGLMMVAALACVPSLPAVAQAPSSEGDVVTVWVVYPPRPKVDMKAATEWTRYHEATPSTFGQPASTVGKNASDHGQTAGSFGTNASDTGTNAGDYGQSPSTVGKNASDHGQTAGSYGQTAGSFGESIDTIADASARANGTNPQPSLLPVPHEKRFDRLEHAIAGVPKLKVHWVEVQSDDLALRMQKTPREDWPDIIAGIPLSQLARAMVIQTLTVPARVLQVENEEPSRGVSATQIAIARSAPHPNNAKAFVLWEREGVEPGGPASSDAEMEKTFRAVGAAKRAVRAYLLGTAVGNIDPEFAEYSPSLAADAAVQHATPKDVTVSAVDALENHGLAEVKVRAVASGDEVFGTVNATVILRKDNDGKWRPLHVTAGLRGEQNDTLFKKLIPYTNGEVGEGTSPATLAAPEDGDNRMPQPQLWWDNHSQATLEIVEWQLNTDAGWTGTSLFLVPEDTGHERTETKAVFARQAGVYRWRVWTMNQGGHVALSTWRTFKVLPGH